MIKWKRDLFSAIAIIAFCIINFIYAMKVPSGVSSVKLAQPDSYLKGWLIILAILAIVLLFQSLKNKAKEVQEKIWGKMAVITVIAITLYLLLMPFLGYGISTSLFLFTTIAIYSLNMGKEKKKGKALLLQVAVWAFIAVVTAILLEYLFRNILSVALPGFSLF